MPDLMATGNDPGTQYIPSEANGVYHEDREVTVVGGPGSQMFRVYGAQFNSDTGNWMLQEGASAAYATVQNPDGSISISLSSPMRKIASTSKDIRSLEGSGGDVRRTFYALPPFLFRLHRTLTPNGALPYRSSIAMGDEATSSGPGR
jgi:hypothetical protein